jgi:hypothetical protein
MAKSHLELVFRTILQRGRRLPQPPTVNTCSYCNVELLKMGGGDVDHRAKRELFDENLCCRQEPQTASSLSISPLSPLLAQPATLSTLSLSQPKGPAHKQRDNPLSIDSRQRQRADSTCTEQHRNTK